VLSLPDEEKMATHAARAVEWPSGSLRQNSPNQESSKSEHGEIFLFVRYRTRDGNPSLIFTNAQILSKQLLELSLNSLVALACDSLQPLPVKNGHLPNPIIDQAGLLQGTSGDGVAHSQNRSGQCFLIRKHQWNCKERLEEERLFASLVDSLLNLRRSAIEVICPIPSGIHRASCLCPGPDLP